MVVYECQRMVFEVDDFMAIHHLTKLIIWAGETLSNHGREVVDLKGNPQVLSSSDGGSVARGADEEEIHLQQNSCTGWNARR